MRRKYAGVSVHPMQLGGKVISEASAPARPESESVMQLYLSGIVTALEEQPHQHFVANVYPSDRNAK
jgi:hypothetical protein